MGPFANLTGILLHDEVVLAALRPAQIELVDGLQTLSGLCIELVWQAPEKIVDGEVAHGTEV